jgi:hypothetical protein
MDELERLGAVPIGYSTPAVNVETCHEAVCGALNVVPAVLIEPGGGSSFKAACSPLAAFLQCPTCCQSSFSASTL